MATPVENPDSALTEIHSKALWMRRQALQMVHSCKSMDFIGQLTPDRAIA